MVNLELSQSAFDRLVIAVNKAKNGTETLRCRVADLEALIVDHGRLLRVTPHTFKGAEK